MKSLKTSTFENRHFISKIVFNLRTPMLLFFTSLAFSQSAAAQVIQPQPVARLISDPIAEARFSRPRRVRPEKNSPSPIETASNNSPALDGATPAERRAFEQTNKARLENGLQPLAWDAELCRMARAHSERMALQGFFSHETPEGLQLKDRAHARGILHFRVIGENISYNKGYDDPGGFAVQRWMTSSGHRANMLYGGFQASAIGSYVAADGSIYLTQVFIAR